MSGEKRVQKNWPYFVLIGLVTLVVWGRSIQYEFVWDDHYFIVENKSVRSLKNIPSMFFSLQAQAASAERFKVFRPLRTAQYAVLYALGGKSMPQPRPFHIANLLWHAAAGMLLFSVALLLFQRQHGAEERFLRWVACGIALAFVVHPVTSEVVCWAKSLDDIMALVFVLAATRSLLQWKPQGKGYIAGLIWFLLAVYSKESAVPFALMTLFIFRSVHQVDWRKSFSLSGGFFAVAAVYMIHRHLIIGQSSQTSPISGSYGQTLLDMFPVVTEYLRLLFGVPPFRIDYLWMKGHFAVTSGPVLVGLVLLAGLILVGAWAWRKRKWSLVGFGLLWTGLFLLPVSNLLPMMQYMAERFLYLPLVGWLLVLGAVLLNMPQWKVSLGWITVVIAIWIPVTWQRETIWKNEQTLFLRSIQEGVHTQRLENNAVRAFLYDPEVSDVFVINTDTGKMDVVRKIPPEKIPVVMRVLNKARQLFPENDDLMAVFGTVELVTQHWAEAVPYFESAVRKDPKNAQWWVNLAVSYGMTDQLQKAGSCLQQALALEPENRGALNLMAQMSAEAGDYPTALSVLQKLQGLDPQNPQTAEFLREVEIKMQARK